MGRLGRRTVGDDGHPAGTDLPRDGHGELYGRRGGHLPVRLRHVVLENAVDARGQRGERGGGGTGGGEERGGGVGGEGEHAPGGDAGAADGEAGELRAPRGGRCTGGGGGGLRGRREGCEAAQRR